MKAKVALQYKEERIDVIMNFWFGDLKSADLPGTERTTLWFGGSEEIDKNIRERFLEDVTDALEGKLAYWAETPRGRLALIILLDQFTRNIFRNNPQAFAGDSGALQLCLEGMKLKHDHNLALIQRVFFYIPLEHSEDLHMQKQSVICFKTLANICMPETAAIYQAFLKYAVMHYDIIKQFGRFPHRNPILGRESTESEILFLSQAND